uniref:Phosphoribosyl-ATP diphosphatase n=1 Tax=Alexandrium catenella TaxID=2925 RepID=A0A7S1WMQ4_ALECA
MDRTPAAALQKEASEASQEFRQPATLDSVASFHRRFGVPIVGTPSMPSRARMDLRLSLIEEEVAELRAALDAGDIIEAADALADVQYVLGGTVHELGMGHCFAELVEEVQRSNMSKACISLDEAEKTVLHYRQTRGVEAKIEEKELDGKTAYLVTRASDGKTLKSIAYSPQGLAPILRQAGAQEADLDLSEELACAAA